MLGVLSPDAPPPPVILLWSDGAFRRYPRALNINALLEWLDEVLAVSPSRPSGAWTEAPRSAQASPILELRTRPIPRMHAPSFGRFRAEHLATSTPAIITGALDGWAASKWSRDALIKRCGARSLNVCAGWPDLYLRLPDVSRPTVPQLSTAPASAFNYTTVEAVLHAQRQGLPLYLHDWSLELFCPALFDDIRSPRYFPADCKLQNSATILRQIDRNHPCASFHPQLSASMHPSLFVSSNRTHSSLHADSRGTRFWMALFHGTKRFRLWNASDTLRCLRATDTDTAHPLQYATTFDDDAFFPDARRSAALAHCVAWEGVLSAGEMIFIPEGWPHAVYNNDDTVAVSYNFYDEWSVAEVHRHARPPLQRHRTVGLFTTLAAAPAGRRRGRSRSTYCSCSLLGTVVGQSAAVRCC